MLTEPHNNKKLLKLNITKDKLFSQFLNNKLHHSILLIGEKGIGKATLAYHLANAILAFHTSLKEIKTDSLFDEIPNKNELLDKDATFNLIKNKNHPDLLIIEKEFDSKTSKINKEIKIASARKILDFMTLSPFISKNKVIIIDSIDEMNISAQNATLKAIEEPSSNTYIFLICNNITKILNTISSRCLKIQIPNYNFSDWKEILFYSCPDKVKTIDQKLLSYLYFLSNASIYKTINLINNNGILLFENIEKILSSELVNIENIHNLSDKIASNEELFNLFSDMIFLFLYKCMTFFTTGNVDEIFKTKNSNFLLKNDLNSILKKIEFVKSIIQDNNVFNLNTKHVVVTIFTSL